MFKILLMRILNKFGCFIFMFKCLLLRFYNMFMKFDVLVVVKELLWFIYYISDNNII